MLKILQAHLLRAFVAKLKIYAIYALYPESFCDKNLASRKVFAFCDSVDNPHLFDDPKLFDDPQLFDDELEEWTLMI